MKYSIVKNDYSESLAKEQEIIKILSTRAWHQDQINPEVVFVIGGDGTFLKAVELYNHQLAKLIFIPIKSGGIGFYTNHNRISDLEEIIDSIKSCKPIEIPLLEVNEYKVINEVKLINNLRPLQADIFINGELLETFKGTGLAFTTPSGSTGFSKSQNGAVIIEENNIFQMLEIAPVANNNFRTINAPIILSRKHHIKVCLHSQNNVSLVIDGNQVDVPKDGVFNINLSEHTVKMISKLTKKTTKVQILNAIFVVNKKYEV